MSERQHAEYVAANQWNRAHNPMAHSALLEDLLYKAWCVIANVSGGRWEEQTEDWQRAARDWRDLWHAHLDGLGVPLPAGWLECSVCGATGTPGSKPCEHFDGAEHGD